MRSSSQHRIIGLIKAIMWFIALLCVQSCSSLQTQAHQQQADQALFDAKRLIAHGEDDAGIEKLKLLSARYPDNPTYRNTLMLEQEVRVTKQLDVAEHLLEKSQFNQSEAAFKSVVNLAPENQRALNGIKKVAIAKKHAISLTKAEQALTEGDNDAARSILRRVLAEDANNEKARGLFETLDQLAIDGKTATPKIKSAFKQPISLEFNNAPVKSVFEYIGKAGGLNFSFDRDINDAITTSIVLRDTPIEDAIGTILTTNQLGKKVLNENTILIYPLSRSQDYEELYVRSFYLNNMAAKQAMALVKTVLHAEDVYIDERLNTLVMRDTLPAIKTAEKLIISQDLVEPEVMLDVEVMEVNRRNLEDLGIRYPDQVALGVKGKDNIPGQLSLAELKNFNSGLGVFSITDPVLALNLLHKDTDTNLLANPKIRVKNRDKAKIHVGDKVPVLTSVANSTGFVSQSINYIEVGIKLEVEPTILIQDQVSIKVQLEVSNITDQVTTSSGVLAYSIGSRNADTTLQLKDGETQVLAGLFRDDRQNTTYKVPGLGDLPLIGGLFTDESNDNQKSEIVLLITPRILHNIVPANAVYTTFPSGVKPTQRNGQLSVPTPMQGQPVPSAAAPVVEKTDQEKQETNASNAQEFARQILQNNDDGGM